MASNSNFESIPRTVSAPPFEGPSEFSQSPAKSTFNVGAQDFCPVAEKKVSMNIDALEFKSEKLLNESAPEFKFNADSDEFETKPSPKLNVAATVFSPNIPKPPIPIIEVDKSFILVNRELTQEDSKSEAFSDVEFPPEFMYSIEEIKEAKINLEEQNLLKDIPPDIEKIKERKSYTNTRPAKQNFRNHDKKRNHERKEEFKRKEQKVFESAEQEAKWRSDLLLEEQKLLDKARAYKARLRIPVEQRDIIKRRIKIALNKLCAANFDRIKVQLLEISKESLDSLDLLSECVFEKACSERKYTSMYAQLCAFISKEFNEFHFSQEAKQKNEFKVSLLFYVEEYFENQEQVEPEIENEEERLEREELIKFKTEGNVRFIGELFNVALLPPKVILYCVSHLIGVAEELYDEIDLLSLEINEGNLAAACILLETGALRLDRQKLKPRTDKIYRFLEDLIQTRKLTNKVKFKIMNLIDERKRNWNKSKVEESKREEEKKMG